MRLAIIVLALSFILASCGPSDGPGSLYAGGPGGIVIAFEPGAPPDIVQDNYLTPMTMVLRASNTGEFDTHNVRVTLSGINANDFPGFNPNPPAITQVRGRALIEDRVIDGTDEFLELGEAYYAHALSTSDLEFTLHAKACYGYATLATASVCMSDDYYTDPACDPERSSVSVSSAPVTISNLQTSVAGTNRLRISFDVAKNGPRVWAPYPSQNCTADRVSLTREADWVHVGVSDGFAGDEIDCSGLLDGDPSWNHEWILGFDQFNVRPQQAADAEGFVKLTDGSGRVQCVLTVPQGLDGVSTIDIVTSYVAESTTSKRFTVERSGTSGGSLPAGVSTSGSGGSPGSPTSGVHCIRRVTINFETRLFEGHSQAECDDIDRRVQQFIDENSIIPP
jgi:hypothetical protein